MDSNQNLILGLPRRPREENDDVAAIIGAILDGIAGKPLFSQTLPLKTAVRHYFLQNNCRLYSFTVRQNPLKLCSKQIINGL